MSEARAEQGRRVLDEALRLLDVVQATRPAGSGSDPATPAAAECRICPLCRGIAHLREANPEAAERLTSAVVDLAAAVRDLFGGVSAGSAPDAAGSGGGGGGDGGDGDVPRVDVQHIDVQHIDVTD